MGKWSKRSRMTLESGFSSNQVGFNDSQKRLVSWRIIKHPNEKGLFDELIYASSPLPLCSSWCNILSPNYQSRFLLWLFMSLLGTGLVTLFVPERPSPGSPGVSRCTEFSWIQWVLTWTGQKGAAILTSLSERFPEYYGDGLITPLALVGMLTAHKLDFCFLVSFVFPNGISYLVPQTTVLVQRELHRSWDPQIDVSMRHMSSMSLFLRHRWVQLPRVQMSHTQKQQVPHTRRLGQQSPLKSHYQTPVLLSVVGLSASASFPPSYFCCYYIALLPLLFQKLDFISTPSSWLCKLFAEIQCRLPRFRQLSVVPNIELY